LGKGKGQGKGKGKEGGRERERGKKGKKRKVMISLGGATVTLSLSLLSFPLSLRYISLFSVSSLFLSWLEGLIARRSKNQEQIANIHNSNFDPLLFSICLFHFLRE